jgi:hypothetical protein
MGEWVNQHRVDNVENVLINLSTVALARNAPGMALNLWRGSCVSQLQGWNHLQQSFRAAVSRMFWTTKVTFTPLESGYLPACTTALPQCARQAETATQPSLLHPMSCRHLRRQITEGRLLAICDPS